MPDPSPSSAPLPSPQPHGSSASHRWSGSARLFAAAAVGAIAVFGVHRAVAAQDSEPYAPASKPAPALAPLHPVHVRGPEGPPTVVIGYSERDGSEIRANCTTCHATREPDRGNATGADLDAFHRGLVVDHGGSTCLTCHDPDSYDRLRLADGRSLAHSESMRLCAQCHGPQHRDWQRGSHGGMSGYWDLTRGPRTRNHCVVCHDPHAPQLRQVLPAPPPNDRFLRGALGADRPPERAHHD